MMRRSAPESIEHASSRLPCDAAAPDVTCAAPNRSPVFFEGDMAFVTGFMVWAVLGIVAGAAIRAVYRAEGTLTALTLIFGLFGAFIGGMLGTAAYIHHDPLPLRLGGILGATIGATTATFLYHYIARNVV
jgi:uncharacterized membrane protein YeaQ/YmgE (transglycosylase-associated protein family)